MQQRPLRIAIVGPRLNIGGTERHIAQIAPLLRREGLDVHVVALAAGGTLDKELERQGVPISTADHNGRRGLNLFSTVLRLRRVLLKIDPDIVHFFLPEPYILGSMGAALAGFRTRIMSRRSLSKYQDKHLLARLLERAQHRGLAAVIGNSTAVCRELALELKSKDKIGLIHNGVEVNTSAGPLGTRHRIRASLDIPESAFVVTTLANLIPYKGHADALEALAIFGKKFHGPWYWLVIGRDEGIGAQLMERAQALGISQNVRFLGQRQDAQDYYYASDIGVLPSHEEGFSNALLEAMASGLPMLASDVGGNPDAIEHGSSGLLFPPRDVPRLAEALLILAHDNDLRVRLAKAAVTRVQQEFSIDACIKRYVRLYNAIAEKRPGPISAVLT